MKQADGDGFESDHVTGSNTNMLRQLPNRGGAKSVAFRAQNEPDDPDLRAVIDAWPTLPVDVKSDILATIRATGD